MSDLNKEMNEEVILDSDFRLCQSTEKLHDKELDTKPTTFVKDAFRRFCKNKSSVVGAIIIGILVLLAIVVPWVSPHNIDNTDLAKTFLPPRVFKSGTGFWDGTKSYSHVIYDVKTDAPAGYKKTSVVKMTNRVDEFIDTTSVYGYGGTVLFVNDKKALTDDYLESDLIAAFLSYRSVNFNQNDNFSISVELNSTDNLKNYKLGEYRLVLAPTDSAKEKIVLKDWSKDYSSFEVNISDVLKENDLTSIEAKIRFELKNLVTDGSIHSYLGINKVVIESDSVNQKVQDLIANISFTDANECIRTTKDNIQDSIHNPDGYWQSTGRKEIAGVEITFVDFKYDWYSDKLGLNKMSIAKSDLETYIQKGYCSFDFLVGASSFKKLSDKCPIEEVLSVENHYDQKLGITITTLECNVTKYKLYGYSKMPAFIFGTTDSGFDLFTLSFRGLRISLVLSLIASSVCFIFGLVWGSISGYFGGNVDLFMERFCDILGGVPWIVMMTLAILLLGNNLVTFALALCLTGWMGTAARTRTQFYRFKGREYILASRTLGAKDSRLIFKHILPNAMGTIITSSVLMIPSTIFSEATLSYLNLGLQGTNSFGNILSHNQVYLNSYPALILFPAVIISLIMISFNLFGNGLRDAFNPSLKGSE